MNSLFKIILCALITTSCSGLSLRAAGPTNIVVEEHILALEPQLGRPFCDNAIFQQNLAVPVWGWTLPGAEVEVTFENQKRTAVAGKDGRWQVKLDPMPADKLTSVHEAPAGRTLSVKTRLGGKEAVKTIHNILIGEVWLCSGQSNMAVKFGNMAFPPNSQKDADYPALRNLEEQWTISTPQTCGGFYSVAFCFGRELQKELLVPIGLMAAAVAGTGIEGWIYVAPGEEPIITKYHNFEPRIAPLAGYAMRGTIWYQGEGNVKDKQGYLPKMKRLIDSWRLLWKQGDFSFYFVQLANMGVSPTNTPAGGDGRAQIRNAQMEALSITNTSMAVAIDIGGKGEHPKNKYDVGIRLARWALNKDYGRKYLVPSGPLFKSFKVEGNTIRVQFDHAQNGLMLAKKDGSLPPVPTPDVPIPWLSVQGKDGSWHWADGKIEGSDLIVSAKAVTEPVAVRYAYTDNPEGCNLYNKDGLPASPFSTNGY